MDSRGLKRGPGTKREKETNAPARWQENAHPISAASDRMSQETLRQAPARARETDRTERNEECSAFCPLLRYMDVRRRGRAMRKCMRVPDRRRRRTSQSCATNCESERTERPYSRQTRYGISDTYRRRHPRAAAQHRSFRQSEFIRKCPLPCCVSLSCTRGWSKE